MTNKPYDLFISHASEDKDALVRPLACELIRLGFDVWYDEFTLAPGDTLYASIENGLANSRFGIVVLSDTFFKKGWTKRELGGLFAMEIAYGKTIIPVWHDISYASLVAHSPMLADKLALNANVGVNELARKIGRVLRPDDSLLGIKGLFLSLAAAEKFCEQEIYERALVELETAAHMDPREHTLHIQAAIENAKSIYASSLVHVGKLREAIDFIDNTTGLPGTHLRSPAHQLTLGLLKHKAHQGLQAAPLDLEAVKLLLDERQQSTVDLYFDPVFMAFSFFDQHGHRDVATALLQRVLEYSTSGQTGRHRELRAAALGKISRYARQAGNFAEGMAATDLLLADFKLPISPEIDSSVAWGYLERQRCLKGLKDHQRSIDCSLALETLFSPYRDKSVADAVAWSLAERSVSLRLAKRYDEARATQAQYLERYLSAAGDSMYLAQTAMVLGEVVYRLRKQNEFHAALDACEVAIDFCKQHADTDVVYELAWCVEEKALLLVELDRLDEALALRESIVREYSSFRGSRFTNLMARCTHNMGFIKILQAKQAMLRGASLSAMTSAFEGAEKLLLAANDVAKAASTWGSLGYIAFLLDDMTLAQERLKSAFALGGSEWHQAEIDDAGRYAIERDADFVQFMEQACV